jgi:predicted ferric reductase
MHGIGAALIAGLLLHHSLYAGRYSQDLAVAWIWIGLFSIAVVTLLFVYLIRPVLQLRVPWSVQSVRPVALKTWELTLEPLGHPGLRYRAGEFVWLNVGKSPFLLVENPFSISSAPASRPRLQFVIKELGDFTKTVGHVRPGTVAYIDGPHGNLVLPGRDEPGVALIAGGVGIAPLIGILRQMRLDGDKRPVVLVYGNRLEDQIVYREELEALARDPSIQIVHVLGEPRKNWKGRKGVIDSELVCELFGDPSSRNWIYILCGPAPMLNVVEDALIGLGVPAGKVRSERFQYD